MNETEMCKAAFIAGVAFAALYLGEKVPLHLVEEAFESWLAQLTEEQ